MRLLLLIRWPFRLTRIAQVKRGALFWELDLTEAVDLSIYLIGAFELRSLRAYRKDIAEGDQVFDIGANIGSHSLQLARLVGAKGKVYAFEPTDYAFNRLKKNSELNPELSPRMHLIHGALMSKESAPLSEELPSSWPLLHLSSDLDPIHGGKRHSTRGAQVDSLDSFVRKNNISKISFIKLDVDGNEAEVLLGAAQTLKRDHPVLMIEIAPSYFNDHPEKFDEFVGLLREIGYHFEDPATHSRGRPDPQEFRNLVKPGTGRNFFFRIP